MFTTVLRTFLRVCRVSVFGMVSRKSWRFDVKDCQPVSLTTLLEQSCWLVQNKPWPHHQPAQCCRKGLHTMDDFTV